MPPGPGQSVVEQTGGLFIGSVALGLLWELGAKRSFRNEILATSKLGSQVDVFGLSWVGTWDDVDTRKWDALFSGASRVDIFFAYGSTWRHTHNVRLHKLAGRSGVTLNVYLPDPTKSEVTTLLAQRFGGIAAEELRAKIFESARDFYAMRQPNGATIQVHFFRKDPVFTVYRFDGSAVMTLYSHNVGRADVPVFICQAGGDLYDFIDDELKSSNQSRRRVKSLPRHERYGNLSVTTAPSVVLLRGDLTKELADLFHDAPMQAWDIETSGLDWRVDRIGTCQLYADKAGSVVVQFDDHFPELLLGVLADSQVTKVFHHAPFDLRFMTSHWNVHARNVADTKVASKLLEPTAPNSEHSLKSLLARHLQIQISKDQQVSDWLAPELTAEQLAYAVSDVAYLVPLLETLEGKLQEAGLTDLFRQCLAFLPTRVALEVGGYPDVFSH